MSHLPFHFEIIPCKKGCLECHQPFQTNDVVFSSFNPNKWQREDFCKTCFSARKEEVFWKRVYKSEKNESKGLPIDEEGKFLQLKTHLEKNEFQEAFILALYLQRKKVLLKRKENIKKEGKGDHSLYEHVTTGEIVIVPSQPLSSLKLTDLYQQIKEYRLN